MYTEIQPFTYERPTRLSDALSLLDQLHRSGQTATLAAGATDLIPRLKIARTDPGTVVSLSALRELAGIRVQPGQVIEIGALTALSDLETPLRPHLPGLADAARAIAIPQIRNRGTVGGNLLADTRCVFFNQGDQSRDSFGPCFKAAGTVCHLVPGAGKDPDKPSCRARFISDLAPVLLTLGAEVEIHSLSRGARKFPLRELYRPDGIRRHGLAPDEILTAVRIDLTRRRGATYEKLRIRRSLDFPSLGVAVGIEAPTPGAGATRSVLRLSLTGLESIPPLYESEFDEATPDTALLERLADEASRQARPLKQDFFSPTYRKRMIPVLAHRAYDRLRKEWAHP